MYKQAYINLIKARIARLKKSIPSLEKDLEEREIIIKARYGKRG